ncbi:hypothetical protein BDY21DRAFT_384470 [Lineolata rhizophorae]|uniref:Uncharacterized protein n=1 Tax=Lineolata rhizophorae TaxID=578093 RepID=A0A6A6P9D1_9PEZI|nr:hypothetical protein BDY21DRAFT_384470 [Lineolata rhizophorae]
MKTAFCTTARSYLGSIYNGLLDDSDQPPVSTKHITDLAAIFVRYNAYEVLGIQLIHGHFKILENSIMVGTNFENLALRRAKNTEIDDIDPANIYGHIFVLTADGLYAYEFQDGPLPDLSGVGQGFLPEFVNYIIRNNLTSLIGLQVLGCGDKSMSELILDQGTVMLDSSVVKNTLPTRVTVFNAGSPHPKLEIVKDLMLVLADVGVL